jgi:deoxyribose-phosphate aldolase
LIALNKSAIARLIDHTLLKPEATPDQVERLCDEARRFGFAAVCIHPVYVSLAAAHLAGSESAVCTVAGFPLGSTTTDVKMYEASRALEDGADEVDMVIHVGALKAGDHGRVKDDIAALVAVCHNGGALLKVIIEAVLLERDEKIAACQLAKEAGADFVKTSTGFAGGGATVGDVRLMRRMVGDRMGVKAAGGVRSYADVLAMVEAGANRIGASAGVEIVGQAPD